MLEDIVHRLLGVKEVRRYDIGVEVFITNREGKRLGPIVCKHEVSVYFVKRMRWAKAMVWGPYRIYTKLTPEELTGSHRSTFRHETIHLLQWLDLKDKFLREYIKSSLKGLFTKLSPYRENKFEKEAFRVELEYVRSGRPLFWREADDDPID